MKFEKFFKSVGTHGLIVKRSEVESWLVCGSVAMKIPNGVNNLSVSSDPNFLFKAVVNSTSDGIDGLTLKAAIINDPEGKASDIIRVFETDLGDKVGIYNSAYGLIERKDRLTYLEVESENEIDHKVTTYKFIVVRDYNDDAIGFIYGCDEI